MQRAILLQSNATVSKKKILKAFSIDAIKLANFMLSKRKSKHMMSLHNSVYLPARQSTLFGSQVICDIIRNVSKINNDSIKEITVKFNVPRNCKVFNTKSQLFVKLIPYARKPISIPICKNRNYQRYTSLINSGWLCKTYGLTSDGQIVAYLTKKDTAITKHKNIIGIDTNSNCFAVTVLSSNGSVIKQLYYGQDIWNKRKHIINYRTILHKYANINSHKAIQKLKKTKHKEYNYVRNRVGEIVRDITNLAIQYNADIGIENLHKFKSVRHANFKVQRIPFYKFKLNLENRCFDKGINLHIIDAYHTSKWCSHCGAVAKNGHSSNYSLFKCSTCGQEVNSDRKASLAIAIKTNLVRNKHTLEQDAFFQFTRFRVPVNELIKHSDYETGSYTVYPKPISMERYLIK